MTSAFQIRIFIFRNIYKWEYLRVPPIPGHKPRRTKIHNSGVIEIVVVEWQGKESKGDWKGMAGSRDAAPHQKWRS